MPPPKFAISVERLFEELALSTASPLARAPEPVHHLRGMCFAVHAVDTVPATVGAAVAAAVFQILSLGANVILPSTSSFLHCAAFISELVEGRDMRPSLSTCRRRGGGVLPVPLYAKATS